MSKESPIDQDCPTCGDTLYPWKHSVMCQDCGAMVECNSDLAKGCFEFVCAKCAPSSDSLNRNKPLVICGPYCDGVYHLNTATGEYTNHSD